MVCVNVIYTEYIVVARAELRGRSVSDLGDQHPQAAGEVTPKPHGAE